ncbi:hypothetical protein J7I91_20065 [Pseudomonas sp. ISL-84]|nr:hypothetical protein [Pseudomonas sp. ISL-84]
MTAISLLHVRLEFEFEIELEMNILKLAVFTRSSLPEDEPWIRVSEAFNV